jgi:hypothetical protein
VIHYWDDYDGNSGVIISQLYELLIHGEKTREITTKAWIHPDIFEVACKRAFPRLNERRYSVVENNCEV